jgi:hypothetical protein
MSSNKPKNTSDALGTPSALEQAKRLVIERLATIDNVETITILIKEAKDFYLNQVEMLESIYELQVEMITRSEPANKGLKDLLLIYNDSSARWQELFAGTQKRLDDIQKEKDEATKEHNRLKNSALEDHLMLNEILENRMIEITGLNESKTFIKKHMLK